MRFSLSLTEDKRIGFSAVSGLRMLGIHHYGSMLSETLELHVQWHRIKKRYTLEARDKICNHFWADLKTILPDN